MDESRRKPNLDNYFRLLLEFTQKFKDYHFIMFFGQYTAKTRDIQEIQDGFFSKGGKEISDNFTI